MSEEAPRYRETESNQFWRTLYKRYADEHIGLYLPENLDQVLQVIADGSRLPESWGGTAKDKLLTVSYYLGYAFMFFIWEEHSPFKPFEGVWRLNFDLLNQPARVLRIGCASEGSSLLEQSALEKAGVVADDYVVVDLCSIPLKRIKILFPTAKTRVEDAKNLSFPDDSFDLVTTDSLFGSNTKQAELGILRELRRVLRGNGLLVCKNWVVGNRSSEGLPDKEVGLVWRDKIISKFGVDSGRDGLAGLTEGQWLKLGGYYVDFIQSTYYSESGWLRRGLDLIELCHEAGFEMVECLRFSKEEIQEARSPLLLKQDGMFIFSFQKRDKDVSRKEKNLPPKPSEARLNKI